MKQQLKLIMVLLLVFSYNYLYAESPFSATDVLNTKTCSTPAVSPDGKHVAYIVNVPQGSNRCPWFRIQRIICC